MKMRSNILSATKHEVLVEGAAAARAAATPVFADITRFAEPSPTRMVWMPTTSGQHPSFV